MQTKEFYDSDQKLFWRGWVWNRLQERFSALERRQATVLYLVGPHDFDREVALKKGFSNQNLIAVDTCKQYVENVRKQKNLAIQGRLQDILVAWPKDWKIDAVVADFTCGLDDQLLQFQGSLVISKPGHVAVNLQRGRDQASNTLRQDFRNFKQKYKRKIASFGDDDLVQRISDSVDSKHRGKQLYILMLNHCMNSVRGVLDVNATAYCSMFYDITDPKFTSYRQSPQQPYMDSVVFTMPAAFNEMGYEKLEEFWVDWVGYNQLPQMRRRIAALRAIRTMKHVSGTRTI